MKTVNRIVMTVAGAFLIVAAALKTSQLLTEPILSKGFWESWAFFVFQIPLEFGLGIWLVCGLFRKAAWLLGTIAFCGFIFVTGYKAFGGAASCGCFGTVHVNPWITLLTIDIPLFVLLVIFRPKGEKLLPPPWPSAKHFFGVAIPTVVLLVTIVPVLIFNKPPEKTDRYEVVKPHEWTTIKPVKPPPFLPHHDANAVTTVKPPAADANPEPNKMVSANRRQENEWPMLKMITIADSLRSGVVVVLLYHYDCPGCQEAIPMYNRLCSELSGNDDAIRFAFIAAPPYGSEKEDPVPTDTKCLKGKLQSDKKEIIMTPLVVLLQEGAVIKVSGRYSTNLDELLNAFSQ